MTPSARPYVVTKGDLNVYVMVSRSSFVWKQVAAQLRRSEEDLRRIHTSLQFRLEKTERVGDVLRGKFVVTASGGSPQQVVAALDAMLSVLSSYLAEKQPPVYEAATAQYAIDGYVGTKVPYEEATGDRSKLVVYVER